MDVLNNIASFFIELSRNNPLVIMWILFMNGGWVIVSIGLVRLWWIMRLYRLQGKYAKTVTYTILAIDIPKASEQTPKAMEQVFATISGAHMDINKKEKYLKGLFQLSFSFEIVSIDGYIQFLIRTPSVFRDLVESAIYAHYPDSEITEVYDYTEGLPSKYPNDSHNLWGSELQLVANEALPIRTYESFEDKMTQELKDPLAGVLETMSRIQKGEQVWLQIIVCPTENSAWVKRNLAYAYKLAGKKVDTGSKSWYSPILNFLYTMFDDWIDWIPGKRLDAGKDSGPDFRILNLTPGERASIEAVERKASKIGFICKLRLLYIAPHDIYSAKRVISSVFGGMKQFGDLTSNSFKPNKRTKTSAVYFFPAQRANARRGRILSNYRNRSWYAGSRSYILNTEELATLYHFPSISVTTPYLKRTDVKKSDAPAQLPAGLENLIDREENDLREQLEGLSLDNNYYERMYSKKAPTQANVDVRPHTPATSHLRDQLESLGAKEPANVPSNLPIIDEH